MKILVFILSTLSSLYSFACDQNQASYLADRIDEDETQSCLILDQTFETMNQHIDENGALHLPSFGKFEDGHRVMFNSSNSLSRVLRNQGDLDFNCYNDLTEKLMRKLRVGVELSCLYLEQTLLMIVQQLKSHPQRDLVVPNFGRFRLDTDTTIPIRAIPRWFPQDIHIDFYPY